MLRVRVISVCLVAALFAGCRPARVLLTPFPPQVESLEGHARLSVTGEQGTARSRFSFIFHPPGAGRIEVSDFLGRSLYQIVITRLGAFFVLPSKKVYWQGSEEEIIQRLLGFPLNLEEIIVLISGQEARGGGSAGMAAWTLDRDSRGRIEAGQRGEFRFKTLEFIEDTPVAGVLIFEHPATHGRLKILSIAFNRPVPAAAFDTAFLDGFEPKTWEEIQEMIQNED